MGGAAGEVALREAGPRQPDQAAGLVRSQHPGPAVSTLGLQSKFWDCSSSSSRNGPGTGRNEDASRSSGLTDSSTWTLRMHVHPVSHVQNEKPVLVHMFPHAAGHAFHGHQSTPEAARGVGTEAMQP